MDKQKKRQKRERDQAPAIICLSWRPKDLRIDTFVQMLLKETEADVEEANQQQQIRSTAPLWKNGNW